jgi:hypothetical protein
MVSSKCPDNVTEYLPSTCTEKSDIPFGFYAQKVAGNEKYYGKYYSKLNIPNAPEIAPRPSLKFMDKFLHNDKDN